MTSLEFKKKRQALKMTQKQLAENLGISRFSVIRYEQGKTKINKRTEFLIKTLN